MIYKVIWENDNHQAGESINFTAAFLDDCFNASRQHIGSMTDLIAERAGLTRGDASRVVGEYFFGV